MQILWKTVDVGDSFEIQVGLGFCALACLFSSGKNSKIAVLPEKELEQALSSSIDLEHFLSLHSSEKRTYFKSLRLLFRSHDVRNKLEALCATQHLSFDKPFLIPEEQTLFQFIPREGRIRMAKKNKIKVMIVDDSETIQKLLIHILEKDPLIECTQAILDPTKVEAAIMQDPPDVITMDIHMPKMDGVTLLKKILKTQSIPIVMISSLSKEEGNFVLEALENGAIDYIQKPSLSEVDKVSELIREKIKNAAAAKIKISKKSGNSAVLHPLKTLEHQTSDILIAIGASTGGPEAIRAILTQLPSPIPPILITQHIPKTFSKALSERLHQLCPFEVKEAESGDEIQSNRVLIAPGGLQMKVVQHHQKLSVVLEDFETPNRHKPSIDVLFESLVPLKGIQLIAAILTGMGDDGAQGLLSLKNKGAWTLAQDEASCVVFGMPREAIELQAAQEVVPLEQMAHRFSLIISELRKKSL